MNWACSQSQEEEANHQCCLEKRHVDVFPRAFDDANVTECRSNALGSLPCWEGPVAGAMMNQAEKLKGQNVLIIAPAC